MLRAISGTRNSLLIGVAIGLIASIVFVAGFTAGTLVAHSTAEPYGTSDKNLQDFLSAYRLVTQRSYYKHVSHQALVYAAIDGMFAATGDPHTMFLSPTENKQAGSELNGTNYGGIGAIVVPVKYGLRVLSPLHGTPAARAGLRDGDLVTAIDGKPVSGMNGNTAVFRIHGPAGSVVSLTVRRGDRTLVIPVTRQHIAATTAYGRLLGRHLAYVQIFSFGSDTAGQVRSALSQVLHPGIRGLVLDLRGNPGGYVDAAQQIVSDFISRGVVAYEKNSDGTLQPLTVQAGDQIVHVPVAILVDGDTASAAEITAAALHDEDHAVLVGTRTYGKGSMQSVYTMSDGSSMRITDRLWLTPRKRSIQQVGIQPDLIVAPGAGNSGNDPQLNAAERSLLQHPAT
jgi:carboxyl-terminal processing protease